MANNINVHIVEENRPNIANFGGLYGKRIFKAERIAVITDFGKRQQEAKENNGLFLNRNIFRFKTQAIDITGLNLEKDIDGEYVIVINKGLEDESGRSIEVRCPMTSKKFTKDVTVDTISDALNNGSTNTAFFSSGKKLTEYLNRQNDKEMTKIEALKDELTRIYGAIRQTADNNVANTEAYYRQLDDKGSKTEVHVHVEEQSYEQHATAYRTQCVAYSNYVR